MGNFNELVNNWNNIEKKLVVSRLDLMEAKYNLKCVEAEATKVGDVTGNNERERKAALFIITMPEINKVDMAQAVVWELEVEASYRKALMYNALWNGTGQEGSFRGLNV